VAADKDALRESIREQLVVKLRRRLKRLNVMYWTLEPKKRWRILPVMVQTRSDL
jgi:hypothetical protein